VRLRAAFLAGAAAAAVLATTAPLATAALPRSTAKARAKFFGAANVDRAGRVRSDRVILTWFGVASLAASFRGHVVLLDTFINNTGPGNCSLGTAPGPRVPRYVPTSYAKLAVLRPEAIFIGHGHYDHECRTGELIARTGAKLVGLPQHCALAAAQAAAYRGSQRPFRCVPTVSSFSPFGASAAIRPLGRGVPITVIRHVHSGAASGPVANANGAETLLYRFRAGRFSLVWNDSTGPLREKAPGVLSLLRGLPATDVQFGASLGLGVGEQGFRDPVDYAQALRAKVYYPIHQDLASVDGSSRVFRPRLAAEMASRTGLTTKLRWLQDPGDYMRPIVFRPSAQRWSR
jgi:hypothetical protein